MANAENKTKPTAVSVADFLAAVEPEAKRTDAMALDALFRRVTGWQPAMWGPSMIGYGSYHYRYDSGREGDAMATGFSPRKPETVVYINTGYENEGPLLARLGPHRIGKSCLYLKRMADIDQGVLEELIRGGIAALSERYPVTAS
jgi:hypothetical protein